MKKVLFSLGASAFFVLIFAAMACAQEGGASPEAIQFFSWVAIATGIGMGIAAIGTGIGQGHGVQGACDGIARNPEASGKILTALILGLAMIESLAIYALVIELILLYANPFLQYIVG
ncbi:MAG: ATP synthase subunit c, sodium ion specific [Deltaproteobacteria bacterium ADurb.BinA179]|jgi:F-type H+-transporting ATPase subunit c|nr:ATP synthase F0 subunit C [Deltaproteobacteria bacterium]MDI9543342.1 ATP synthase F0 subunit C [Pseudomonadota bacterium]NLW67763.1 ATP synthase F0 subunit C [Bacteriovoracaceae bacterium]OPZ23671.1 MAG: ATP synthase subunit c, sodium ion specific [Deltaproteobacteria bacterium ADurb.BinA179]HRR20297.1 ATP synthase F0 subunit C [Desulfomonilia bacterium]